MTFPYSTREQKRYDAAEDGVLEDVKHLLGKGDDININLPYTYTSGQTSIYIAAKGGYTFNTVLLMATGLAVVAIQFITL